MEFVAAMDASDGAADNYAIAPARCLSGQQTFSVRSRELWPQLVFARLRAGAVLHITYANSSNLEAQNAYD